MTDLELRAKVHEVGKRCLAMATTATGELASTGVRACIVELHGLVELLLTRLEDDDELEARVLVVIARMRAEGKL